MKNLPTNLQDLKNASLIAEDNYETKLWKIGKNKYAITRDWQKRPIHAFESEKFTALLKVLDDEILYIGVTHSTCKMCPCENVMMGIEIHLKTGAIYHIGHDDEVRKAHIVDLKP